jgi:hypothetical protein
VIKNALTRVSRHSAPQLFGSGCELMVFHCERVMSSNEKKMRPPPRARVDRSKKIGATQSVDTQRAAVRSMIG